MKKLVAIVMACLLLCSCSYIDMKIIPAKKGEQLKRYVWTARANSTYAYDRLDDRLKPVYKDIAEACLSVTPKVNTDRVVRNDLKLVFIAIERDYPLISWLGETYSFTDHISGGSTVKIDYDKTADEVNLLLAKINAHATMLLENISPDLSDYEKALMAHDLVINTIEYDKDAPDQREVYGAIVDKRATCQGYAKAYQFLLLTLGLDSTLIFGESGELHAWNAVEIDGQYYYSDPTFDDRLLADGQSYLSREYFLVDQKNMAKTHTIDTDDTVFGLPNCDKTDENYFVKNNLIVDTPDRLLVETLAKELAVKAIKKKETAFQIKFSSAELMDKVKNEFISNGQLDTAINFEVSRYGGVSYIGRAFEESSNTISFILTY